MGCNGVYSGKGPRGFRGGCDRGLGLDGLVGEGGCFLDRLGLFCGGDGVQCCRMFEEEMGEVWEGRLFRRGG